jgi:hypothetical protein
MCTCVFMALKAMRKHLIIKEVKHACVCVYLCTENLQDEVLFLWSADNWWPVSCVSTVFQFKLVLTTVESRFVSLCAAHIHVEHNFFLLCHLKLCVIRNNSHASHTYKYTHRRVHSAERWGDALWAWRAGICATPTHSAHVEQLTCHTQTHTNTHIHTHSAKRWGYAQWAWRAGISAAPVHSAHVERISWQRETLSADGLAQWRPGKML